MCCVCVAAVLRVGVGMLVMFVLRLGSVCWSIIRFMCIQHTCVCDVYVGDIYEKGRICCGGACCVVVVVVLK